MDVSFLEAHIRMVRFFERFFEDFPNGFIGLMIRKVWKRRSFERSDSD